MTVLFDPRWIGLWAVVAVVVVVLAVNARRRQPVRGRYRTGAAVWGGVPARRGRRHTTPPGGVTAVVSGAG